MAVSGSIIRTNQSTRALHLISDGFLTPGRDPLPAGGASLFGEGLILTGLPGRRIERFDDFHVLHAFFTRTAQALIIENAIRKYSSSGANWSRLPKFANRLPLDRQRILRPWAFQAGSA